MISHIRHVWVVLGILMITGWLYWPGLSQSFVSWDDEGHITENQQVRHFGFNNVRNIFHSDVNRTYIPLTILTFSIEHYFWGFNPSVYHFDNLILHLAVVILIYILALRLGLGVAAATISAFLFAVHPIHVESVIWITQRKDVLYSFFYVMSLLFYLSYVQKNNGLFYFLAMLGGTLSILAKPMALSLPLIFFLMDWYIKRQWNIRLIFEKIPFLLVIIPVAWLTYAMNMRAMDFRFPESVLTWIWCFVFYVLKFFCPLNLSVLYQLPQPVSIFHAEFVVAGLFFLTFTGIVLWFKNQRLLLFAMGYYILSIFFLLRIDSSADLTFVADRFMYLPSLGFCLLTGWIVQQWMTIAVPLRFIRYIIPLGVISVSVGLLLLSFHRVNLWGNEIKLWGEAVQRYPCAVAYSQLGNAYLKHNDLSNAAVNFRRAMSINPYYSKPISNYGIILVKSGLYEQAVQFFDRALVLDKNTSAVIYNNRGYAQMRLGRNELAMDDFNRAIQADRQYIPAYLNKATLFKNVKDYVRCEEELNMVLRLEPDNAVAFNNIRILKRMINEQVTR